MDNQANARIFVKNKISLSRKRFDEVVEYFIYCYNRILKDKVKVSHQECKNKTKLDFEFCLKENLVSFLQNPVNKINSQIDIIQTVEFQQETNKTYTQDGITSVDEIDIFVSNLGLSSTWGDVNIEDIYFAFECKRLKNTSNSNAYILDIEKFVQRDYWQTGFRFPFNGLIGFVEKSSISLNKIIFDIELKLISNTKIKSVRTDNNILVKIDNSNFKYLRKSLHNHNSANLNIEVNHLFFDYSNIIVE